MLREGLEIEPLEGALIVVLVVEADLAKIGDQDPVRRDMMAYR